MELKIEIEKELKNLILLIKNKEERIIIEKYRKNIDKLLKEYLKDL